MNKRIFALATVALASVIVLAEDAIQKDRKEKQTLMQP